MIVSPPWSGMENEWPPLKKCIQFKCHMLQPFLQKFDWEDDESDETEYEDFSSDDEDGNVRRFAFKPSTLRKFIHQVRTTRGYDVDASVPAFMCNPFSMYSEESIRVYGEWVNHAIELAINHINSKTKKFYKHVDTLKVVDTRHRVLLLTFTAGEVEPPPNVNKQMKKEKNEKKKEKKKKKKKENKKKKVADVTTDVADVANKQTFLAAVYAPAAVLGTFELQECLLKPEGPAPWKHFDLETRSLF